MKIHNKWLNKVILLVGMFLFLGCYNESENGIYMAFAAEIPSGTYRLYFDTQGGSEIEEIYIVTNGIPYTKLPVPAKLGHTFLGWYTKKDGGVLVDKDSIVNLSADQTLYARWGVKTLYIHFDAKGGSLSVQQKECDYGQAYGKLPQPTKDDMIFLGWYTERGELVTEESICSLATHHTLYARWKSESDGADLIDLSFQFENATEDFQYKEDYKIPMLRFQYIFGDTVYANNLFEQQTNWSGNSFGMAVLSVMLYENDTDLKKEDFSLGITNNWQLQVVDINKNLWFTAVEIIEILQIMEKDMDIQKAYHENKDKIHGICSAVENCQNNIDTPVLIHMSGPQGGHTVVGYKLEGDSLYIYDPDYPSTVRKITVYMDEEGKSNGWSYQVKEGYFWGSGQEGCSISYLDYEIYKKVWEERSKESEEDFCIISQNIGTSALMDEKENILAVLKGNKFSTHRDDIFLVMESSFDVNSQMNYICVPEGMYMVENLESDSHEFSAGIMSLKQGNQVKTTARKIKLILDKGKKVNGVGIKSPKEHTYCASIASNLSEDKKTIEAVGVGNSTQDFWLINNNQNIELLNGDNSYVEIDGKNIKTHTVSLDSSKGGEINIKGVQDNSSESQSVIDGEKVVILATAKKGYYLADLLINGESVGPSNTYEIDNIRETKSVVGIFDVFDEEDITVDTIPTQIYTGKEITPSITIRIGDVVLKENVDYKLSYTNNINMGIAKVKIKGIATYEELNLTKLFYITLDKGMIYEKNNIIYEIESVSEDGKTGSVCIIGYTKSEQLLTLSATVKIGKSIFKVVKIKEGAFQNCSCLESEIVIGKYVTVIEENAFYACEGVRKVVIGKKVKEIGACAFSMCQQLKTVVFKSGNVKKIGEAAFEQNKKGRVFKYPKGKANYYKKLLKNKT